ncbi:MAG TPA: ATP-dependent metallopeptidase FtsH/Yme1/Tma family protein, partial [Streptosporangiaceae bacterium]|nr:ATP-dependent metallopeptidase FtsH/Yme1/Tma family protein [Streptosporangiaceae bacterium]
MDVKRYFRGPLLWILLFGLLVALVMWGVNPGGSYEKTDTSKVITAINNNQVRSALVVDKDQRIEITLKDGGKKQQASWVNGQGKDLANVLQQKAQQGQLPGGYNVQVPKQNLFVSLLFSFLPIVVVVLIFLFIMNQMQGGGSRVMNFGKSKAKLITKDTPKTTFNDVAGADEAIEELQEIKDFLQNPAKFQAIGAKIPKGVLLYGPPGTGKTLLAR